MSSSITARSASTRASSCATATTGTSAFPIIQAASPARSIHSKDYEEPRPAAQQARARHRRRQLGLRHRLRGARVGASCDWSLRSGYWFLPKTAFGTPLTDLPIWGLPVFLQRLILRALVRVFIGDYRAYGLQQPDAQAVRAPSRIRHRRAQLPAAGTHQAAPRHRALLGHQGAFHRRQHRRVRPDRRRNRLHNSLPVPAEGPRADRERRRARLRRRLPRRGQEPLHRRLGAGAQRLRLAADAGRQPLRRDDRAAGRDRAADRLRPEVARAQAADHATSSIPAARAA